MANYFRNIPKIKYDIFGTEPNTYTNVTNITKRLRFKPKVIEDITEYYTYRVKDGDRPDIISYQKYGTVGYAYLLMLINDIQDPLFDWPLSTQQFEQYIANKYGSVESAQTTTKYYYQTIRSEVERTGTAERVPEVKYIVDSTTYDSLAVGSRSTQTEYEWEEELNDEKRNIKIINEDFITELDYEVKKSFV